MGLSNFCYHSKFNFSFKHDCRDLVLNCKILLLLCVNYFSKVPKITMGMDFKLWEVVPAED